MTGAINADQHGNDILDKLDKAAKHLSAPEH